MLTLNILPQELRIDQVPLNPQWSKWSFTPLYKMQAEGTQLYWQIGFDGRNSLEIEHGTDDKPPLTDRVQVDPSAALPEARLRYRAKYREGYRPGGASSFTNIKGMKGYDYKPNSIKSWPVYTQPKINGVRMLCSNAGGGISMRSWLNNPFNHLDHLKSELNGFFEYLPTYSTLDGELYNHNLSFASLISAVRTVTTSHHLLREVQYWIFDISYEDHRGAPFEKRYELLVNAFNLYVQDCGKFPLTFNILPCQLARDNSEVMLQHNSHVAMGYEGIMVKKISNGAPPGSKLYTESLYKQDKGNHILKYKSFTDDEATIVRIISSGENEVEAFEVRDKVGKQFNVQLRGHGKSAGGLDVRNERRGSDDVVGKKMTIRYVDESTYIGIAIRDYE